MRKHGFIVLLLACFLVSLPVVAVDLEFTDSFSFQENIETTIIISKEEVQNPIVLEIELFSRSIISSFSYAGSDDIVNTAIIEADDPNNYIYKTVKRRCEHPSFLGIA